MIHLYDVFMLGGVFCSSICSIILFRSKYQIYTNRLLSVILFLTAWYVLLFLLVLSGYITQFPYGFKITGHFYFMVPPLSYIYVRGVIYHEDRFRGTDWIHFILAGLIFFDYIPYFFATRENVERLAGAVVLDINTSYKADVTLIAPSWYYKIRSVQGIIYIIMQWMLLFKIPSFFKNKNIRQPVPESVTSWLIVFTVFGSLLYAGLQARNLADILHLQMDVNALSLWIISFCFFFLSIYLFFNPRVLYNAYYKISYSGSEDHPHQPVLISDRTSSSPSLSSINEIAGTNTNSREQMDPDLLKLYTVKIEEYVINNKVFMKPGINIHALASDLGISVRNLSYILNHYYNQRFNDFINNYRVNYIIGRFENGDWKYLTFEGLAKEAGFSSRSTFFSVFKKLKGITPSEYLTKIGEGSDPHVKDM